MKTRMFLLMMAVTVVAGCAHSGGPAPAVCNQTQVDHVLIHFADSKLFVTPPKYTAHRGRNFKITFINPAALNGSDVTISSATPWLNGTGNKAGGTHPIVICVPGNASLADHKYEVIVTDVGRLDPHVKVVP
jgi:hypothetical protein